MDDAAVVCALEGQRDLAGQSQRLVHREWTTRQPFRERLALHQLEHEPAPAVGVREPVNRRDLRVVQCREDARLAVEPRPAVRIVRQPAGRILIATGLPICMSSAR